MATSYARMAATGGWHREGRGVSFRSITSKNIEKEGIEEASVYQTTTTRWTGSI